MSLLVLSSLVVLPSALPSAQAAPYGGSEPTPTNLTVFLHNSSTPLPITGGIFASEVLTSTNDSARPWRGGGVLDVGLHFLTAPFYLFPRVAGPLTLNGTPVADVFVNQTGSVTSGSWTMTLYSVDPSGVATPIGTPGVTTYASGYSGSIGLPIRIVYGSPLHLTLPTGWSLEAVFAQGTGTTSDHYGFWWGDVANTYYPADLNVPASTYLAINQTTVVGPNGAVTGSLNNTVRTPVASLRANLSDPLGNYDYTNWTVNWTVTNLTGGLFGAGTMSAFGPNVPPAPYGYNETYVVAYNYSWLPSGGYKFCANGTDNTNHNDYLFTGQWFGRAASGCTGFFVGSAPNLLTLHVLDSAHKVLVGARVVVANLLNFTDATGVTQFHLANGTYTGTVMWEGIVVANPSITVVGPTDLTVLTKVYYPTFTIEDQASAPLSNALVYVVHPNGTQYPLMVTGATGTLNFTQVPGGAYGITVIWHGSVVYSQPSQPSVTVAGNVSYPVVTQVFYQAFQVITPTGAPLPLASVLVENTTTGLVLAFGITNSSGITTARVPAGTFTVLVYWQTSLVATVAGLGLPAATNPYVITVSLYQVSFLALDSKGIPVADADIAIHSGGGLITTLVTSSAGTAGIDLPGGTYTFTTQWEGIVVDTRVVTVSAPTTLTLNLSVYYLTFQTQDAQGLPVPTASIGWSTPLGQANGSVTTGITGLSTVRLPGAAYSVSTSWEGVVVNTTSIALGSTETVVLHLAVYYLTVDTVDKSGSELSGVFLQVLSASTGVAVASAMTTTHASVFRLPVGSYAVVGTYASTYDLTPVAQTLNQSVSLSASSTVTLKFTDVNPAFTSTNEFYAIVGFVLLLVVLVAAVIFSSRRQRKGHSAAAAAPPKAETKESEAWSEGPHKEGADQGPSKGETNGSAGAEAPASSGPSQPE